MNYKDHLPKHKRKQKIATRHNLLWNSIREIKMHPDARWLFCVLDSFANKQGESCFPSVSTILKVSGLGRTRFYELRSMLESAGWIKTIPRLTKTG
ncbi:MAG TPA: hypothetical protein DCQ83_06170, partial [Fibrobacteres bacterium]|nr:hypothetical protein [Fibrobacterota bacterium]